MEQIHIDLFFRQKKKKYFRKQYFNPFKIMLNSSFYYWRPNAVYFVWQQTAWSEKKAQNGG